MKLSAVFLLLLNFFLLLPQFAAAQDSLLDVPTLPTGVLSLPEPGKGPNIGTVIKSETAPEYKAIIPPEIYRLIRTEELAVDAVARLQFAWRRDDKWESKSDQRVAEKLTINPNGLIESGKMPGEGFWFGSGSSLVSEFEAAKDKEEAQRLIGFKILWNVASNFSGLGVVDFLFDMQWLKEDKVYRRAAGEFLRVYPGILNLDEKSEQLFREKIFFNEPVPLSRFSLLTYRFRSADEDMLWLYSPATEKVRQLTGSNRSDPLVTSEISADDMLCWSGKIDTVKPTKVEKSVQLVPFPSTELAGLTETPDGCAQVQENDSGSGLGGISNKWNFESHRYAAAGWAPTKVVFAPRELWRIELTSRDPYSLNGRQVLYVDVASQLPVYKVVFDRAGMQWKTMICPFGLAANDTRSKKVPYLDSMVLVDSQKKSSFLLDTGRTRYCGSYPEGVSLADLVPSKLGPDSPAGSS